MITLRSSVSIKIHERKKTVVSRQIEQFISVRDTVTCYRLWRRVERGNRGAYHRS